MAVKDWDAAHRTAPLIPDLPSLRSIPDVDQRFFLRMYLRSNMQRDVDEARGRCLAFGIDFEVARREAQRS